MQKVSYEEMLKAVKAAHPMWAIGNVYRFDKASNVFTFEQWIEREYRRLDHGN